MTGCPAYLPPATLMGFPLSDTVSLLTGNGSIAPFETDSTLIDASSLRHRRG